MFLRKNSQTFNRKDSSNSSNLEPIYHEIRPIESPVTTFFQVFGL